MIQVELSVVVPCYNEAGNLHELVDRLLIVFTKRKVRGEIVLVNDGSRDKTGEVIDALARDHPEVVPVHHEKNRGLAAGWDSGVAKATGVYVCLIDADLQYQPEDVARLHRELLHTRVDMVQGRRSSIGRQRDSRYHLSRGLNLLLNTLFGMSLFDNKSGFVIARRETLADILHHRYKYAYFQTFIAVSAHAKGYSIRDIETVFETRLVGQSFIPSFPFSLILKVFPDLAKGFVEFRLAPKRETLVANFLARNPPARADEELSWSRRWRRAIYFRTMPLHAWLLTRRTELYYRELKQSQWLSLGQMRKLQDEKLRRLVSHAYHHVGFYRERMQSLGLGPDDIKTVDDLPKLPMLSKADVRENLHFDLLSDNHDNDLILRIATSGSTGEPFVCYADQHQLEIRLASTLRSMEWTGWKFGDRQARLWHQTLGMSPSQVARERFDAWLLRRLFLPAFEMSEGAMSAFLGRLSAYEPVLIDGYAESFNYLAGHLGSAKDRPGFRPLGIISSAQALPDESRRIIEDAFGTRVFDKYGSREFSGIAYECGAHDGHHVMAESYIVEILKDGRKALPGEVGEVVITDLNNLCLPFIRYRVGDLAEAMDDTKPCACGRGLPRVGRIEGRVQSLVIGAHGRVMPGSFFLHVLKDYDYLVRQFQVVQEERGAIILKVVKGSRFAPDLFEKEILSVFRQYLGEETRIDVQFVDLIPLVRTGKRQAVISKLSLDFQKLDYPDRREPE
ncbi:MAG: glycosyltransferase [Vicinamibacteria bacterium]